MNETAPIVHFVDDDASFLIAISRLLRASGFRTTIACDLSSSLSASWLFSRRPSFSG